MKNLKDQYLQYTQESKWINLMFQIYGKMHHLLYIKNSEITFKSISLKPLVGTLNGYHSSYENDVHVLLHENIVSRLIYIAKVHLILPKWSHVGLTKKDLKTLTTEIETKPMHNSFQN